VRAVLCCCDGLRVRRYTKPGVGLPGLRPADFLLVLKLDASTKLRPNHEGREHHVLHATQTTPLHVSVGQDSRRAATPPTEQCRRSHQNENVKKGVIKSRWGTEGSRYPGAGASHGVPFAGISTCPASIPYPSRGVQRERQIRLSVSRLSLSVWCVYDRNGNTLTSHKGPIISSGVKTHSQLLTAYDSGGACIKIIIQMLIRLLLC